MCAEKGLIPLKFYGPDREVYPYFTYRESSIM